MSAPTVELVDVEKVYGAERSELAVRAVGGVSFKVERGESVAIIGPSGCGKSTLLHILGCLDRPTRGTYRLQGRDAAAMGEDERAALRNRYIGFVFQSFNLLPRMNARENVELPLLYSSFADTAERAQQVLVRVGLADRAHHMPSELSGGQKQRVAIARALVTGPALLLCDEPTGALDSRTGREILDLLVELNGEGTTVVMVTHDLALARTMQRSIWMRDGLAVMDGPSSAVVERFLAEATAELEGAA